MQPFCSDRELRKASVLLCCRPASRRQFLEACEWLVKHAESKIGKLICRQYVRETVNVVQVVEQGDGEPALLITREKGPPHGVVILYRSPAGRLLLTASGCRPADLPRFDRREAAFRALYRLKHVRVNEDAWTYDEMAVPFSCRRTASQVVHRYKRYRERNAPVPWRVVP